MFVLSLCFIGLAARNCKNVFCNCRIVERLNLCLVCVYSEAVKAVAFMREGHSGFAVFRRPKSRSLTNLIIASFPKTTQRGWSY